MLQYDAQNERVERYPVAAGPQGREGFTPRPSEFTMRDVLYTVFRHKWKILLLFLMTTAGAVMVVSDAKDYYESEAKIMIKNSRRDFALNPIQDSGSLLENAQVPRDSLRTEMSLLQSVSLYGAVVDRVGVERVLWNPDALARPAGAAGDAEKDATAQAAGATGVEKLEGRARDVAQRVQTGLNLQTNEVTLREIAITVVERSLDVRPDMPGSNVLRLAYRARDPWQAKEILEAVVEVYREQHIEAHKYAISPELLANKSREYQEQLTVKENELAALKKQLAITSLPDQKTGLENQLAALAAQQTEMNIAIGGWKAKIDAYSSELGNTAARATKPGEASGSAQPAASPMSSRMSDMIQQQLVQFQMREAAMAGRLADTNPELRELRSNIRNLETMIASQQPDPVTGAVGPVAAGSPLGDSLRMLQKIAHAELNSQTAGLAELEVQITQTRGRLNGLIEHERAVRKLEREVADLENEYDLFRKSQSGLEVSQMLDQNQVSNVAVQQEPTASAISTKNVRKLLVLLMFGSLSGLGAGLVLAFALDFINPTLRRPEDVERCLGLPVMVSIPRTRKHRPMVTRRPA
jgi:uncharacterized protein involved in exopolysaccharide biosynthesis